MTIKKDTTFLPHQACPECGELAAYRDMVEVTEFIAGNSEITLRFCSEGCANQWCIKWLNNGELP